MKANDNVSMLNILNALINNPQNTLGLFSTFVLGAAGLFLAGQLEGLYSILGYTITLGAGIFSLYFTIPLMGSILDEGKPVQSASETSDGRDDLYHEATLYAAYGRYEQAKPILVQHLERYPADEKAITLMAEIEQQIK